MKYKTALITGGKGFLLSNFIDFLKLYFRHVIYFEGDISNSEQYSKIKKNYKHIDCIIHFASPSDKIDFQNKNKVHDTMLTGSMHLIELAKFYQSKFIFASSMAVENITDLHTPYGAYKLAIEQYIIDSNLNYLILRIPRVYDASRNKGLIKQLKDNSIPSKDYTKIVHDIISLPDFISSTKYTFKTFLFNDYQKRIFNYQNLENLSIEQIKNKFL
jgi:nucleoside-diphosphate-sugar epimerase